MKDDEAYGEDEMLVRLNEQIHESDRPMKTVAIVFGLLFLFCGAFGFRLAARRGLEIGLQNQEEEDGVLYRAGPRSAVKDYHRTLHGKIPPAAQTGRFLAAYIAENRAALIALCENDFRRRKV